MRTRNDSASIRTYRLILQEDYGLPPTLVEPGQASAGRRRSPRHESVGATLLPAPVLETQASVGTNPSEIIHLAYAHALTKGHPDVRVAVLDTGVNLLAQGTSEERWWTAPTS